MKYTDLSSKTRFSYHWINFAAASLLAVALAGCSSGGGGGDAAPAAPAPGGGAAAPAVPVPPGAPVAVGALTPAQFAAITPVVPAVAVTVASAPKVTFSLTNGVGGPPLTGFGSKSQSATATVAQFPNLAFALAKLIPETTIVVAGRTLVTPSRWVSYIVTTVPTTTAAKTATRPSTDNTGTLVDNGNGTYTYTFFRDITLAKADVQALVTAGTITAASAADLDDLTFNANAVHRLTIQISGNAPGTGSNTPTAVTTTPGVPISNPANVIFDFIPATGQPVASGRDIVATAKCNECHQSLGGFPDASEAASDATFHGGNRNNVQYCSVCHTEQRKFGRTEAVLDPANSNNYVPGGSTNRIEGRAVGHLATFNHRIHMSANLTKTGYNYGGVVLEEACKFPQDVRNCTKCHDGSATATNRTAQGDNWKNVPNRVACGSCHDGINFTTGAGVTLANKIADVAAGVAVGTTATGHDGGAQPDDAACGFCHAPSAIDVNHLPVTAPNRVNALLVAAAAGGNTNTNAGSIASNPARLPAGAIKVSYEIQSAALNASRNPVMVFRMLLQNGAAAPAPATFNTFNPALPIGTQEILPNFMGAPSVYFVYAVPQDGIAAPADFNASASAYLRSLWNGTAAAGSSLTGPDANGFYTATLAPVIPANAVMLTGGVGYSYNVTSALPLTQTNVAGFPTAPSTLVGLNANMTNRTGGLIVVTPNVQRVATGFIARRAVVSDALCNACHQELGAFTEEAFHAGQRNDGTTCSWCHTPNRASSGWSADSTVFVHAIHAAAKRTVPYNWHAASATDGFYTIGYPGILNNCETCHLPNTYDFSAAGSTIPSPNNRQYRTVQTGTLLSTSATAFAFAPATLAPRDVDRGAGFAFDANGAPTPGAAAGNPLNLVTSPIASVCTACHDTDVAMQHITNEGGSIYQPRGAPAAGAVAATGALAKTELCMLCHSPTSAFGLGIKAVHAAR